MDLRKRNENSQIRTATRADAAPVHAVRADQDGRTADTCGSAAVKERVSELDALELQTLSGSS